MVKRDDVMPLLLQACPSFARRWEDHKANWGNEAPSLYVSLGEFALHLFDLFQQGTWEEFPPVFDAIEKLHVEGDPDVKQAALVGLLGKLQDIADDANMDPTIFVRFMQPVSAEWWRRANGV